jgi:hypothetical protein
MLFPSWFQKKLPRDIAENLKLPEQYTHLHLAKLVLYHLHKMVEILSKDPQPELLPEKKKGSRFAEDYKWGYEDDDTPSYKYHSECFFPLFCLRYGSKQLSPYLVKLLDHARELMTSLPFPIARFQAEGGGAYELYAQLFLLPTH